MHLIHFGEVLCDLRNKLGLSPCEMADRLKMSGPSLLAIEGSPTPPDDANCRLYRDAFGIDPYCYAWCRCGDASRMPPGVREAADALTDAMDQHVAAMIARHGKTSSGGL